jgi:hypothetical protein
MEWNWGWVRVDRTKKRIPPHQEKMEKNSFCSLFSVHF